MTKIIELLPDDASETVLDAMAEGRLCRYAVELEDEVALLRAALEFYANPDNYPIEARLIVVARETLDRT